MKAAVVSEYAYTFQLLSGTSAPYTASYVTTLPTTTLSSQIQVVSSISGATPLQLQTAFTITAWIYLNTSGGGVILDAPYTTHDEPFYSYHLRTSGSGLFFGYNDAGSYYSVETAGSSLTFNTWQHVAVVYNKASAYVRTFVNGAPYNASAITLTTVGYYAVPLTVGRAPNWSPVFAGRIGMVKVFKDKAFTNAEVAADYAVTFAG